MKQMYRIRDLAYIIGGSMVTAVGVAGFVTPAKLAGGGVRGIAVILYHLWNYEVGTSLFLLSLPMFYAGFLHYWEPYCSPYSRSYSESYSDSKESFLTTTPSTPYFRHFSEGFSADSEWVWC